MSTIKALRIDAGKPSQVIDLDLGIGRLNDILGSFDHSGCELGNVYVGEWSLHEDPVNAAATMLWWKIKPMADGTYPFCGTAIITGPVNAIGYDTDVLPLVLDLLAGQPAANPADMKQFEALQAEWQESTRPYYELRGRDR